MGKVTLRLRVTVDEDDNEPYICMSDLSQIVKSQPPKTFDEFARWLDDLDTDLRNCGDDFENIVSRYQLKEK